jgi:hypothetical protein
MSIPDEQRGAFTMQALATMGVDPEWDRKLSAYLRAEALQFADEKWGVYSEANDAYSRELTVLEQRHGQSPRTPQIKALFASANSDLERAYEAWATQYFRPFLQAAWDLAACPSPSLAAALFKVELIHRDEIWNDSDFEGDAMAIVATEMSDLARVGGRSKVANHDCGPAARSDGHDTALMAAWSTRQQAMAAIRLRGSFYMAPDHSPAETLANDKAEQAIADLRADTIEGVLAKLWVSLAQHLAPQDGDQESGLWLSATKADIPALAEFEDDFDFPQRLIFSAIRDLSAQTGREVRP